MRNRFLASLILAIGLTPLAIGADSLSAQATNPCPRPTARRFAPAEIVELNSPDRFLCRIEFRESGIQLLPHPNGTRPDPGQRVIRDSRGRFYTTNAAGFRSVIAVWDAKGAFVRTIGRPGGGPGELSTRGALSIFVDSRDRLHIRDGGPSWSIFSPDHEFVQKVPSLNMGGIQGTTIVLDSDEVLTSQRAGGEGMGQRANFFRVADFNGKPLRSFAPIDPALLQIEPYFERALGYAGGTRFWAGPPTNDGRGYVLELWSTDGQLLRTMKRPVPWFPEGLKPPPQRREGQPPTGPPPPNLDMLHIDASGLLVVLIGVPNEKWRWIADPRERDAREHEMWDGIIEVIDTESATVLVSERMEVTRAMREIPRGFFPGKNTGYRMAETAEGLPVVKIVDYRLVAR
jgi:hypothetical protein